MHGQRGVAAALGEAQHRIIRDLSAEADAAAAHDAALVIKTDTRSNIDVLRLLDLLFTEAALALAMLDAEFLESALASLIADRAVERMIDQQEFHHAFAHFLSQRALRADAHAFRDRIGTSDDRTRHPADVGHPVLVLFRLRAGGWTRRHAHLHKAHAAIAGGGKLGVIAVVRDFFLHLLAGLDHPHALRELMPDTIDLNIHEIRRRRWGGGSRGRFGGGHGTWRRNLNEYRSRMDSSNPIL